MNPPHDSRPDSEGPDPRERAAESGSGDRWTEAIRILEKRRARTLESGAGARGDRRVG